MKMEEERMNMNYDRRPIIVPLRGTENNRHMSLARKIIEGSPCGEFSEYNAPWAIQAALYEKKQRVLASGTKTNI